MSAFLTFSQAWLCMSFGLSIVFSVYNTDGSDGSLTVVLVVVVCAIRTRAQDVQQFSDHAAWVLRG